MKKTLLLAFVSMFAMQAQASTQDLINNVKNGNISGVLELLDNGEDVNGTDAGGTTALHYAVASDNASITQILLSHGADLNAANAKGWTPLKIAEKKDLKNVTPILVQYLQLQNNSVTDSAARVAEEAAVAVKEVPEQIKETVTETVAVIKDVPANVSDTVQENVAIAAEEVEVAVPEIAVSQAEVVKEETAEVTAPQTESVNEEVTVAVEEAKDDYQQMIDAAAQTVIEARSAQTKAEAEAKILADELKQIKAEKAELEAKLAEKEKNEEVKKDEKKEPEKEVKTEVAKPASKPAKPILQKKPVYKAPQPIVKKVELVPSSIADGIYVGDEEIVYCLDYLGNGEDNNLKRAAGHFAASASISEERYKQIVDKANEFFMNADDKTLTTQDSSCSKIITPSNHDKANQIIRSMNKSVGY